LGWKSEIASSALKKALPFKPLLRRLKRRLVPCSSSLAGHAIAIEHGIKLINMLRACGFHVTGKVGLEVGTGWVPTIPLIHLLCGAERLYLTDVARYLDEHTLNLARQNVQMHAGLIERELALSQRVIEESIAETGDLEGRLEYIAPIEWSAVTPESVDYAFSRAVLEHVSPGQIPDLLAAVFRTLKPGGLMANIIDNSDHFQHHDQSITRLNFLRFSKISWSIICALTDRQNRLRHSDYRRVFSSSSFQVLYEERCVDRDALAALDDLAIDTAFMRHDREDLASLTSYFVLRKPE
jgi:Methyltransferase domain